MGPRQSEDGAFLRLTIDSDPQPCKISQENARVRFGDPLPTFVHHKDVADLKPPETGDDRFFGFDSGVSGIGPGVLLILKRPTSGNRRIEDERHQYFRPSSRADLISSKVTLPVRFRSSRILANALSTSCCRRSTSGTILAM